MITTWADGFGVWHVRVSRYKGFPLLCARKAIRDELQQREPNVAREVWLHLVRIPKHDTDDTIVYREGDNPNVYSERPLTKLSDG